MDQEYVILHFAIVPEKLKQKKKAKDVYIAVTPNFQEEIITCM